MTTALAKPDPIYELLGQYKTAIKNVLPSHLTPERVLRVAYTAIQRTPKLRNCSHASLVNAILEASILGLDIGRTAHIIPFGREAVFIPDYKGFIDLAHRSDRIESFPFKPVYENDEFEYSEGTTRYIKHKPHSGENRGKLVAAYAIVFFKHGGYDFEVVEKPDIVATKKRSPSRDKKDSPWNQPDLEWTMWCKTAVRRLAKRVPQSPELQRAAFLEELHEAGLKQDLKYVDDVIEIVPTSDLTEKIQANATGPDATRLPEPDKAPEPETTEKQESAATTTELGKEPEKTEEPDPWEKGKWWNMRSGSPEKGTGFAAYCLKHKDTFFNNSLDIQGMVGVKWESLYPDAPFPFAEKPEVVEHETKTDDPPLDQEPPPEDNPEDNPENGFLYCPEANGGKKHITVCRNKCSYGKAGTCNALINHDAKKRSETQADETSDMIKALNSFDEKIRTEAFKRHGIEEPQVKSTLPTETLRAVLTMAYVVEEEFKSDKF